ncbi:type VI secretion protein (plasmid) [Xanthomonas citri pv. citri]|uniref:TrbI/VirB10 family protein n=1 Tax=Xanthomonas citri TaxID=346 RepID=UPI00052C601B|nr:TrbI/VirB10 family protein [Xanthomonas citri]OMG02770.1 type VI secretion protein [Xanthomonas citri pv. citri]PIB18455.1 type VI secretion protein [Xanthomonas citri pv. citri]CEE80318.1 VirB10 protein [Xanthomonas citri pv. citri]CEH60093.1 VirB10 protein [Xanthomonas citri pv. citri]
MSDQTNKPQEDREAAVREWEKQANASLVADDRKKKMSGIAIAAIAAVGLGAVWYMKHGGSEPAKPVGNSELSIPERKPVPKLKEQESASAAAVTSTPAATPANATQAGDPMKAQREQMEMQRQEQERRMLEARRKSAIIPPNSNNQAAASAQPAGDSGDQGQSNAGMLGGGSGDRGAQDPNSRFARAVSGDDVAVSKANQIDNLPYKVLQGKLIEAVLEPRAISDLPGMVCATVQRDVYGAQDRNKLIPWGSRVCGVYSAEVRKGQDRLFVIWNTVRRPDGVQVALDSAGADQLGTAGMGGIVDTHFAGIFGTSALLSIIGAGASNAGVSSGDQYNSAAAYRQSVQQAAAQTSQSVLQPYINIPPTITVPAGSRVRIYVNKDLDFTAIYKDEIDGAKRGDGVTFIQ